MDRVQAIAEFASSAAHSAGQSREAWRELPLDPGGELKAEAPQDKGYPDSKHHHGRQHESCRANPPIDRQSGKRFGKRISASRKAVTVPKSKIRSTIHTAICE